MAITLKVEKFVNFAEAWPLYLERFAELNKYTIQRHLMTITEFTEIMNDGQILKYLAYNDNGELVGLSAYTNQLSRVPLISEDYFAHHYPKHFVEGRIWYCLFVAVRLHSPGAFIELVESMYHKATETDSIICLDICHYNELERQLPRTVAYALTRINPNLNWLRADKQSYFIYYTSRKSWTDMQENIPVSKLA